MPDQRDAKVSCNYNATVDFNSGGATFLTRVRDANSHTIAGHNSTLSVEKMCCDANSPIAHFTICPFIPRNKVMKRELGMLVLQTVIVGGIAANVVPH